MRTIVDQYREQYQVAARIDKMSIATFLVEKLKRSGTRFLQRNADGWQEVDDDTAREKIQKVIRLKSKHDDVSNEKISRSCTSYGEAQSPSPKRLKRSHINAHTPPTKNIMGGLSA